MKDLVIPARRVKTELIILAVCFGIAMMVNIGCIIAYHTPWYEVFTQIGFVCFVTAILYVASIIVRLIIAGIRKLF